VTTCPARRRLRRYALVIRNHQFMQLVAAHQHNVTAADALQPILPAGA